MSTRKRARFETEATAPNESEIDHATSSSANLSQSERMISFRKVAVKRAEHFARAEVVDESVAPSTTPIGRLRAVKTGAIKKEAAHAAGAPADAANGTVGDSEKEAWPGPWSTARSILAQRDQIKQAREEREKREKLAGNYIDLDAENLVLDVYDTAVSNLSWQPARLAEEGAVMNYVPKLSTICLKLLSKYVDNFESFDALSTEHMDSLADQLGKEKRLDLTNCVRLAVPGARSLYLPDCGAIDEDSLITSVETVNGTSTTTINDEQVVVTDHDVSPIQRLVLKSCGRCFTDKVAAAIYNHIHALETLVIAGCYRLSDSGLVKLLESCSATLQSLDVSCNNRLGEVGLRAIGQLQSLTCLKLDYITHLTNSNFSLLISSGDSTVQLLPALTEISLMGCHEVGDESLVPFLTLYGAQLTAFSTSSYSVADNTIVCMREHCRNLETLRLVTMAEVTAAAIIGLFVVNTHPVTREVTNSIGPLQVVDLRGGVSVFDEAIVQLAMNYGRYIYDLSLNGCSRLTNRAAAALWMHATDNLKTLDISFVRGFSEAAVGTFVDRCLQLELLRIWGCTQITQKLLAGHGNPRLQIVGNFTQN